MFRDRYRTQSLRMQQWDYASDAVYFVTVNARGRADWLTDRHVGKVSSDFWHVIPKHFHYVQTDAFVLMPDHVHGVLVFQSSSVETRRDGHQIAPSVETRDLASLQKCIYSPQKPRNYQPNKFGPLRPGSLQAVIHAYKGAVTRWCRTHGYEDFYWQKGFYERRLRSFEELSEVRSYIDRNPSEYLAYV